MPHVFEARSPLPVSADEAYAWHMRPGAFERLCPPWETVRVLKRDGEIADGGTVEVSVPLAGPVRMRWLAEHFGFVPGREFHDRQVRGPFAQFEHTHRFDPQGAMASELIDHLEYRLPLGALGDLIASGKIKRQFGRMFAYRHRVTQADLAAHAQYRDREPLHVAITGASGLVGSAVAAFLSTGGQQVTKLLRPGPSRGNLDGIRTASWNSETGDIELTGDETPQAIVHLAGENIAGRRWSTKVKERIKNSRVVVTRRLCERLANQARRPQVLVCASAIGCYGDRGDESLTEASSPGAGFLAGVCREWEEATRPAVEAGIRVVNLRFGMIVTAAGGALAKMLPPFQFGGGGIVGSGRQWWSWISLDDVVGAILHALRTDELRGPVNAVAPESLTNHDFTKTLGRVLRRPTIVPLPAFAARIVLGEMANDLLLSSARVVPEKLTASNYRFRYPTLEAALRHVLGK